MLNARTHAGFAIAATLFLLVQARAHADYISETFSLNSRLAGANAGSVIAEANNGSATVNGLLSGQVRLTFNLNPSPVYTKVGPDVGFESVGFFTDLPLTSSQITAPKGWTSFGAAMPSSPPNFDSWQVYAGKEADRTAPVVLLISGLGNQPTLGHFVTPVQGFLPNEYSEPPAIIFVAYVGYPGTGIAPVWEDNLSTVVTATPEPSTLAMAGVGLVGIALARRHRMRPRLRARRNPPHN